MNKYYKTIVTVEVLSEEPIPNWTDLENLNYQITYGDWSGEVNIGTSEEVDAKTIAKLLINQGSDPGFFNLDQEGNPSEL